MKTNYGQSALHTAPPLANRTSSSTMTIPQMTNSPMTSTTAANNDLFDMFASAPPPVPVTVNSSSGLDDLLGL